MRDPSPENISGEKVQRHVFKHSINWGYVAIAVAVALVAVKFAPAVASDDEGNTEVPAIGTEL
jgi:hypothetical protein